MTLAPRDPRIGSGLEPEFAFHRGRFGSELVYAFVAGLASADGAGRAKHRVAESRIASRYISSYGEYGAWLYVHKDLYANLGLGFVIDKSLDR